MKLFFQGLGCLLCLFLIQNKAVAQKELTRACGIQIIVDKYLWEHYLRNAENEEEKERENLARYNIVSLVGRLVNQANRVIQAQYFAKYKYKLLLKDIKILRSDDECGDVCTEDLDLESLLNSYSYSPRDSYCLSYLLTYRSFKNGKLGLAYTATSFHGGVCETFREQKEDLYGYERTVNKSLNTGVVSLNRNGRQVSEAVAALTFAHEIGHSFGSPHDPAECQPDPESGGTYVMYQSGSLGQQKNNMVLSECSIASMSRVLSSLEIRESGTCWSLDSGRGTCGNSVVEVWEECDCGRDPEVCASQCCVPPDDPEGRPPCKLVQGAQCSPTEGLCCSSSCTFSTDSRVCAATTDCTKETKCTGKTSYCPIAPSYEDGTRCAGGSRSCQNGLCTGSICQTLGMLPCSPAYTESFTACQPHCYSPSIPCSPANQSYPDGSECSVGELYGYCGAGACLLGSELGGQSSWVVGVAIFAGFYLMFMVCAGWIYCRYCRPRSL